MRQIFVDTFYWIAIADIKDEWHQRSLQISESLLPARLVTTDSVLIEFVNFFSRYGPNVRRKIVQSVHDILDAADITVVSQTRPAMLSGMALLASRADKQYSLTDCISMQVMRELGIFEVLTHDEHFRQEGFVTLLQS